MAKERPSRSSSLHTWKAGPSAVGSNVGAYMASGRTAPNPALARTECTQCDFIFLMVPLRRSKETFEMSLCNIFSLTQLCPKY